MFNFLLLDRGKEEGIIQNTVFNRGRSWVGGVEKTGHVWEGETLRREMRQESFCYLVERRTRTPDRTPSPDHAATSGIGTTCRDTSNPPMDTVSKAIGPATYSDVP
jgi:hypothetical protein